MASLIPRRFFNPATEGDTVTTLDYVARVGYLAKGLVYGLVGILAGKAAFEVGNSPPGKEDAFQTIIEAPFGRVILGVTAVGLLCYVAWRVMQVVLDPGGKGNGWKGWAIRLGFAVSGLFYLVMSVQAGWFAWRGSVPDAGDAAEGVTGSEKATGLMLGVPFGWIPVMIAGAIFVGVGLHHFYRSWSAKFMKDYEHTEMSQVERRIVRPVGVLGLAARGFTFSLIGLFLMRAGWRQNSGEVKGLEGSFEALMAYSWGWIALLILAIGFVLYGLYCFSRAKYRRFVEGEV
ncbi:DUF1206 domain-containing protein [Alienimonas chondri]|uniref:DUF1206 domain-containing protein n=1 Tax=Alienimonas chondri TaxID=2681879 RepID=A0ABX1VKJ5_9PLAN|nr:DUF1206 domain-containing protein [Alienimonas chondri]NNJ27891.1 hypothetical protein [Alienimonas chondri]